jgi:O-antigen/teichoic acid export membrane protein
MDAAARLRSRLPTLYRSTTLRATLVFSFAGVAHMLGSLLLARQLSPVEFAGVALFLAFNQVGTSLGTAGADTIVVRHKLSPNLRLLGTVTMFACLVGAVLFVVSGTAYDMSLALAALIFAGIVASTIVRVEGAFYQSKQKFRVSLFLHQSHNFVLLAVALAALILGFQEAVVPCALMTMCFPLMAVWGWRALTRSFAGSQNSASPYPWKEAWSIISYVAAGALSLQAERLLIPQLLSVELLATFAVVAALAGSPFQMLMIGVGYTMMPRLKNSKSLQQARLIVRNELLLVSLVALSGGALVLLFAPLLAELLTAGKYTLSDTLVVAAVLTGICKVLNAFVSAVVRALGTARDLQRLNHSAWFGLAVTVLAALPGARFGLVGLMLAVGLGWLVRSIVVIPAAVAVLTVRTSAAC